MRILLTGSTGRLGRELTQLRDYDYAPTQAEMDITDVNSVNKYVEGKEFDLIVHAAAYTKVEQAEIDQNECFTTNVSATKYLDMLAPYHKARLLYISTEYVFDGRRGFYKETDQPNPLGFYAKTKFYGERTITHGKIVRCLFKPRPWPFEKAYTDQFTSGDYVDVIAKEIDTAITLFDILPSVLHIGTNRKRIFDLAQTTRPDIKEMSRLEVAANIPFDCSLNCSTWQTIKRRYFT